MRQLVFCSIIFSIVLAMSCVKKSVHQNNKLSVYVSIAPQKYFVQKIGGDIVDISILVPPGASPHSYEPKPSQMTGISSAKIFFTIGVEFEKSWIPRIRDNAQHLSIIATDINIQKIVSSENHEHEGDEHSEHSEHGEHDEHHQCSSDGFDPHIWLSPELVKTQAKTICDALCGADSIHKETYVTNYNQFLAEIDSLQVKIKAAFANCPENHTFMIFHPAWGYFAKEFNIIEFPVEIDGKEPSPKELAKIITFAKEKGIKTVFIQPQFSPQSATQIAHEIGATTAEVNDLAENWAENMLHVAQLTGNCKQ